MCHGHFSRKARNSKVSWYMIWWKKQNSIKTSTCSKKTLLKKQHFKDPNISPLHISIYIYTSFLNTLQVTLDHGGILPRSHGHSVTTKSHLWGDTICPASAPKHFGCRWRSPRHNGPRCFCREGFLVAKKSYQMTAWYQNTPEELKNPTRFWFVRLVRFQDCVPPIKKNKKKTRSCQLEQLQSRHGKRNHPLLTLEVIHRIHSWSSIHVRYIHLLFHMISPCRKETTIHWNKTILLQQETCQRNKHAFNLKSSVQKSDESIWIYTYLYHSSYIFFPPPAVNPLPLPLPMLPLEKSTPHLRWLGTFRSGKKDNSAGPKLMAPRSSGSQSLQGMAGIKGSTLAPLLKFREFIEGTCVDIWY